MMSEQELVTRCVELAAAGDRQAVATLAVIEERDQLRKLTLAEAERVAAQSALLSSRAEVVQVEPPRFDGNTPMTTTRAGRRVSEGGTQGP